MPLCPLRNFYGQVKGYGFLSGFDFSVRSTLKSETEKTFKNIFFVNSLLTSDHMDTVLIKGDRLNYFSLKSYGDLKLGKLGIQNNKDA